MLGTDGDDELEKSDQDIKIGKKVRKNSSKQTSNRQNSSQQQNKMKRMAAVPATTGGNNTASVQQQSSAFDGEELKQSLTQLLNNSQAVASGEDMDGISIASSSSTKMLSTAPDEAWVEVRVSHKDMVELCYANGSQIINKMTNYVLL